MEHAMKSRKVQGELELVKKPAEVALPMVRHIEHWPLGKLIPYVRNPRTHSEAQIAQIAASIAEFGFLNPILVDTGAGIIAGHGRLRAARKLELPEVPVIVLDHLTDSQKRAYVIADNRLAENAGWDEELLRVELAALAEENFHVPLTGFEDEDLARLLAEQEAAEGLTDEDAVPELQPGQVTLAGDLWILGNHRLLCGDATIQADVERLMASESADLIFTDPPYNVDYEGYTKQRLKISGDRMTAEQFQKFLAASFASYRQIVKPDASVYVCHASQWQREVQNAMDTAGFEVRCQIIWAKNTFAWGWGRYKFQHEPLFYGHVVGRKDAWYGDKSQSTLWEEKKPAANRIHPTAKPVELIERALVNSSKTGDVVADLFGGSGSTLIACERRTRKARLMEIDARYCDATVRRWQAFTGKQALLDDGRPFHAIERERMRVAA
jgi:DNA modification methylase